MPEPVTLVSLLLAAAAAVGNAAVEEATKDAYHAIKNKVGQLFGPRASKAVAKLDDPTTREEGAVELQKYAGGPFDADEASQIQPLVEALILALKEDDAARQYVHARVGLDIEAGGSALIRDIQGAREVLAKVRAASDVTIEGLHLDSGRYPGK